MLTKEVKMTRLVIDYRGRDIGLRNIIETIVHLQSKRKHIAVPEMNI